MKRRLVAALLAMSPLTAFGWFGVLRACNSKLPVSATDIVGAYTFLPEQRPERVGTCLQIMADGTYKAAKLLTREPALHSIGVWKLESGDDASYIAFDGALDIQVWKNGDGSVQLHLADSTGYECLKQN